MRKTSQAALLVLLEQGLVETKDVVEQVRNSALYDLIIEDIIIRCAQLSYA